MAAGIYGIYHGGELLYIGRSGNMKARWGSHRRDLAAGRHHCGSLQEWYDVGEPGHRVLDFQVLEELDSPTMEEICAREAHWFKELCPPHWSRLPGGGMDWSTLLPEQRRAIYQDRSRRASVRRAALTQEHGEAIVEMYLAGYTMEEIAAHLGEGVSYAQVRRILLEKGITPRKPSASTTGEWRRGKTPGEVRKIIQEAMELYPSWEKRAKHLGTSTSALREAAKNVGLLTPKNVYTYRDLINDVGEEKLIALLNERYIHGSDNLDDLAKHLEVGRKVVISAIEHLELEENDAASAKTRTARKNSEKEYSYICLTCQEECSSNDARRRYCSDDCYSASRLIKHICEGCREPYENTSRDSRYCDRRCKFAHYEVEKECASCNEEFTAHHWSAKYCGEC